MTESFDRTGTVPVSLLTSTDWNEEWKALQARHKTPNDVDKWNERAKTFPTAHGSQSSYVKAFLEYADVKPGETVLDMGAGTGALSVPLAKAGCNVIAADFSDGMLSVLEKTAAEEGVRVTCKLMSWFDDWNEAGITENSVDVAIASRSIVTEDLKDSLLRLDRVARRRACITLPCGSSPRIDQQLLHAVGLQNQLGRDYVYAFMILAQNGIYPEVAYIPSKRKETFDTADEAEESLGAIVRAAAEETLDAREIDRALSNLRPWLEHNLVENEHAGEVDRHGTVQKHLRLANPRVITWAFIAWDTNRA